MTQNTVTPDTSFATRFLPFVPLVLVSLLFAVIAVAVTFTQAPKEADAWDYGKHSDLICPTLGTLPTPYVSHLQPPFDSALRQAIGELTLAVGRPLFVAATKTQTLSPVTLRILPAPHSAAQPGQPCEPLKIDEPSLLAAGTMAWFETKRTGDGVLLGATIYVCTEKITAAKTLQSPTARAVRSLGVAAILKHELLHVYLGPNHPRYKCGVFCQNPTIPGIGEQTLTLLKATIKRCLQAQKEANP